MTSNLIKELNNSRQLMSDVSRELSNLSEENRELRIIIWRLIQKHGSEMVNGKIDDETLEKILSSKIYIDDNLNIHLTNVL